MAQIKFTHTPAELVQIKALKAQMEADPNDQAAHQTFINAYKMEDPELEAQYNAWVKKFPDNFTVPFAIGKAYSNREHPRASLFLLRASRLKPDHAEVYYLLANDALFTNNITGRQAYLQKALEYAPDNAEYAINYAFSFKDTDPKRYDSLCLQVVKKFPSSDRAAQALYWLAYGSKTDTQKTTYYNQLYQTKALHHSIWYAYSMTEYFDFLLNTRPEEALIWGQTMVAEDKVFADVWQERLKVATQFKGARKLIHENQGQQALALLNQVSLDNNILGHHINAKESLMLLKAEAANAGGQVRNAFDTIAVAYSKNPTQRLRQVLFSYGSKAGMDSNQVLESVLKIRSSQAKKATDFQLKTTIHQVRLLWLIMQEKWCY